MRTLYLNNRILEVLAGSVTDEVNAAGSAEFTVPARLEPMATGQRVRLEDGNETVWVGRVLRCSEDMDGFYTVSCEGALAYLNDSVMEPYSISGTASAMLAAAVNAHNAQVEEWKRVSVGVVTVDFGTASKESIEHCEVMHYLSECLDRWGGYMHLRPEGSALYLDWLAEGNGDAGAAVIGENISDYTDDLDGEGIVTRYKPLGTLADDGSQLDITSLPDGTADGYTKAGAWVQRDDLVAAYGLISRTLDSDAETAADLLAYAKAELAKVGASRVTQVEIVPGPNVLPGRRMRAMLPSGQAKAIVTSRTWVLEDESQDSAIIGTATATLSEATAARSLPPAVRVSNGSQAISGDLVVGGSAYVGGLSVPNIVIPDETGAYSKVWSDGGTHIIEVYNSNSVPVWRLYFSSSGNLARQQWSGSSWGAAKYAVFGTDTNDIAHQLGAAKTAGDSINLGGYIANGYLTNSKQSAYILINTPYRVYGVTSANCTYSGTFIARQNGRYLFGSTSSNPASLSGLTTAISVSANGWIRMSITGVTQTNAIDNNPISFYFNSLTINYKA